ncbi:heavy-metal-associated domain-containing protein [Streptococcus sp. S784/96/1]|uniref:heavy-metal-associated domain-containing protein n=1 Tax=Streptococcus sp. S784/96/1 TaxID=2653499 RepID=UPI001389B910|nr:heavy metal-associated domain-containing protein [Streptococcus sp. S784/96/1]
MKTYQIIGMKCDGCVKTVTEKLSKVPGVKSVQVDLEKKQVTIEGKTLKFLLKGALKRTKFELGEEV